MTLYEDSVEVMLEESSSSQNLICLEESLDLLDLGLDEKCLKCALHSLSKARE